MPALMVLGVMLGIMGMLYSSHDPMPHHGEARTLAVNYAVFRNAAFLYAEQNKEASGTIAANALELPSDWKALRSWQARMEARRCYVYGSASAQEIEAARELFLGSFAVGRAQGGRIMPQPGAPVPVPPFVPEGSLISVIEVR